jgi:5-methylcytosine-specific restriction endonuclease McrA
LSSLCSRCGAAERYSTSSYCQPCHREYQREWYEANRERKMAQNKAWKQEHADRYKQQQLEYRSTDAARTRARLAQQRWRKKHPDKARQKWDARRALKKGAPRVELIDRGYVYERDGGRCHLCRRAVAQKNFHLDHLVPLSRGGEHTHLNVRVAHAFCNLSRGADRSPAQLLLIA